jgi:hypothetical protein
MTTATITASANTWIYGVDAAYSTARNTAVGIAQNLIIGQTTGFEVYRGFLKFDTSILTSAVSVSQVNLRLVATSDNSLTDFDVQIVEQDWSASDPIAAGNQEAVYDACLAAAASTVWRNTSGMSTNTQYTSSNLTAAYVNKTGNTYYSLRSSRDYGNNQPTQKEYINFCLLNNATEAYRPALIVEYTLSTGKFFMFF